MAQNSVSWETRISRALSATLSSRFPLIIELAGLPYTAKTTFVDALSKLFVNTGFSSVTLKERASDCPLGDRWSAEFTIWGITTFISQYLEFRDSGKQIIIADRGLFDALVWLDVKYQKHRCDRLILEQMTALVKTPLWFDHIHLILVFMAPTQAVLNRSTERTLTQRESLVTTEDNIDLLRRSYENQVNIWSKSNLLVQMIEADNMQLRETLARATELVVYSLEALIDLPETGK